MVHDRSLLRLGAWSGLLYILTLGLGWMFLSWFVPPIPPSATAAEVAERYRDHQYLIGAGSIFIMASSVFMLPLGALIMLILQKVEKGIGMLTLMAGFSAVTAAVVTYYTGLNFSMAAFRPDRDPEIVQSFSDLAFSQFIGGIPLFLPLLAVLAWAILKTQDKSDPIAPRWFGYLNLLICILYLPEFLVYVFHTGPFAWNGIIGWWIPFALLVSYLFITPLVLVPIVKRRFP